MTFFDFARKTGAASIPSADWIDNFEDDNITEYSGDTSDFTTESSDPDAKEGTYSLESSVGQTETRIYSNPGDGLDNYFNQGQSMQFWIRFYGDPEGSMGFVYGFESSTTDYYVVRPRIGSGDIRIDKYSDRSYDGNVDSSSVTLNGDTWYRVELTWASDDTHTAEIFDESGTSLVSASGTDSSRSGDGVGWFIYNSHGNVDAAENLSGGTT